MSTLPGGKIANVFRTVTHRFLNGDQYARGMWIDDSSADVIKADFEALYHGDMLVEGETSEQLDDWQPLPTAS
ncbi:Uncharacterised protein [Mycobacterium xenopi]|uniref:Uncharacterized protein n=1 Tax=Mycobacterium xenopi TaxID=1789 RepID=A0AAD1GZG8_MYCXE|nr:hypothetical protein MYXE_14600 [Mycobacterium xenopi]SPX93459.1 Uncharacterised protein [Mycobacterium xenopi]